MPEKEGAEEKSTKSVVNKKQKQMMGEEGYDQLRDQGRIRKNKDKKDATTLPVSDEVKKTRKVVKGPSALERVKADIEKRYGKDAIMKIKKEKTVSEEGKSLLSTPGLDKLKKIKDFKSNADRVFGRKSPDLTKVAESFGGQIVEGPQLLAIPAIKYGVPAAIAVGTAGYDYYKKMRGEKGIFPDLSGVVKSVYDKATGVFKSSSDTQDKNKPIEDPWNEDDYISGGKSKGGGSTSSANQNKNVNPIKKKFKKPEVVGDPVKGKSGGEAPKGGKTKNVFSKIKDIVVGKTRAGQITRATGVSGATATGVTTGFKRRGFRPPGLRVPDGGHVGRRTAG